MNFFLVLENAWLYFEAEMMGIVPGPSAGMDINSILEAAQFWVVPVVFLVIMYKLYQRYQEDAQVKNKPSKAEKYANRKNKRR